MPKRTVISKDSQDNWKNDQIQFARLISELESIGAFSNEIMEGLSEETDLSQSEICEIIDRAQAAWDETKANTNC